MSNGIICYAATPDDRKASRLERLAIASELIAKEMRRLSKPKEVVSLAKELEAHK